MQPPGRAGRRALGIVDPGERVKHLKEENEGRDEQPLGKTLAAQFHHQRGENETAGLRARDKARQYVRLIDDVGIGEEQIVRLKRHDVRKLDALLLRPKFTGPSGRQRAPRHHGEALGGAERGRGVTRDKRGAVAALVVDQDHMERAWIILPDERGDGLGHARASSRAGIMAAMAGQEPPAAPFHAGPSSSRSPASQNPPRAASRYSQIASTIDAMRSLATDSPSRSDPSLSRKCRTKYRTRQGRGTAG